MCGFAVVIGPEAVRAARSAPGWERRLAVVQEALMRRGPDESAWWHSEEAIVASSRLIHWEEGAASQPFTDQAGGFGVFNGELFNLVELQERVRSPGAAEIEVLVIGLRAEGPGFFAAIDGQFAAVLRPCAGQPFVAVRDRFGIAPLYVSGVPGGVALASNLQSLMALAVGTWPLSTEGLQGVLTTWAPTDGRTAFEGISQVAPGELVISDPNGTSHRQSWAAAAFSTRPITETPVATDCDSPESAPSTATPSPPSTVAGKWPTPDPDFLAAELENALRESVRARMRSTTPVACLISGGIDSTIIATLAAQEGARIGVGLVLEGDDVVGARQRQVADATGLDLIQHTLTPAETVEVLHDYVATRRVPLVRLGPVGMTALARRARREGIRAVLSGEGADEMFAGYDSYRVLAARAGLFGPVAGLNWGAFGEPEFDAERGPRWARGYWRSLVRLNAGSPTGRGELLRPVAGMLATALTEAQPMATSDHSPTGDHGLLDRRDDDLRDLLGAYLLTVQGDHAWMEESVELRPPYLSQGVAGLALSHSPADFVAPDNGKQPVRRLLARLAEDNSALAELNFAKAAFRVDVRFVLRDPDAFDRLTELVAHSPTDLIDVHAVLERAAHCRRVATCSEAESMLITFAAGLGVLATARAPVSASCNTDLQHL